MVGRFSVLGFRFLGLRAGDVILRLNGAELRRPGDFYHQLGDLEAGSALHLEIMRHGNLESLEAEMPESERLGMRQPDVKVFGYEGF